MKTLAAKVFDSFGNGGSERSVIVVNLDCRPPPFLLQTHMLRILSSDPVMFMSFLFSAPTLFKHKEKAQSIAGFLGKLLWPSPPRPTPPPPSLLAMAIRRGRISTCALHTLSRYWGSPSQFYCQPPRDHILTR